MIYDWMAFDVLEPLGGHADDERLAYGLAVLANTIGGGRYVTKDRREPYQPAELLLRRGFASQAPEPARLTPEATTAYLTAFFKGVAAQLPQG